MLEGAGFNFSTRLANSIKTFLDGGPNLTQSLTTTNEQVESEPSDERRSAADDLKKCAFMDVSASVQGAAAPESGGNASGAMNILSEKRESMQHASRVGEAGSRTISGKLKKRGNSVKGNAGRGVRIPHQTLGAHVPREPDRPKGVGRSPGVTKYGCPQGYVAVAAKHSSVKSEPISKPAAVSTFKDYTSVVKKSFIDSVLLKEDEWKNHQLKNDESFEVLDQHEQVMVPLHRAASRELYVRDAPTFGAMESHPTLLCEGSMPSNEFTSLKLDAFLNYDCSPTYEGLRRQGNEASQGFHFSGHSVLPESHGDVVLPEEAPFDSKLRRVKQKATRNDVWHVGDTVNTERIDQSAWMQPLQEMGAAGCDHELFGPLVSAFSKDKQANVESYDDYHNFLYRVWAQNPKQKGRRTSDLRKSASVTTSTAYPCSLAARSAILRSPRDLLTSRNLSGFCVAASSGAAGSASPRRRRNNISQDMAATMDTQVELHSAVHMDLSYAARILYTALLYLRTLGGFPTLQRINPLLESSDIVEKENCLELVFVDPSTSGRRKGDSVRASSKLAERVIILRAVLAEKSCIERFGKREVVHILPPLYGPSEAREKPSMNSFPTQALESPRAQNYSPETKGTQRPLTTFATCYAASVASASTDNKRSTNINHGRNVDYGDIAIAFLMSNDASKLSGMLPEPTELEGLRYRVFSLSSCRPDRHKDLEKHTTSAEKAMHNWLSSRLTFSEFDLFKTMEESRVTGQQKPALPLASNTTAHFPLYRPVTIAESTLARMGTVAATPGGTNHADGNNIPHKFYELRLPRLHQHLICAIYSTLGIQLTMNPSSPTSTHSVRDSASSVVAPL